MDNLDMNLNLEFDIKKHKANVIKVIGVGGGGGNAVAYMYQKGIKDVDFVIINTDAQDLHKSPIPIKIQIGKELTEGLGAGAVPEVGKKAAEEDLASIRKVLEDNTKMIFITAGMGGGTGTGAAPVIAKLAKEMGILTVGIVTSPFEFEGKKRIQYAEEGIEELRQYVDSLIIINNNKLREVFGNLKYNEAFAKSDEILSKAASSISEVITSNYKMNVDFRDVKTVLENSGTAIMGTATASGENRARNVIEKALDSPLLNDNNIVGAKNVLLLIISGKEEITLDEMSEINYYIQNESGNSAEIILGIGADERLEDKIGVTIIATGFPKDQQDLIANTKPDRKIHYIKKDREEIFEPEMEIHVPLDDDDYIKTTKEDVLFPNKDVDLKNEVIEKEPVQENEKKYKLGASQDDNEQLINEILDDQMPEHKTRIYKTKKEKTAEQNKTTTQLNDTNIDDIDLAELPYEEAIKLRNKIGIQKPKNLDSKVFNEDVPAFKEMGVEIDLNPKSGKTVSKLESDANGRFKITDSNSFLFDNVD